MEFERSEQEQVEAIKRWWDENGRSLLLGLGIAIVGVLAWQGWTQYQNQKAESASVRYAALQGALGTEPEAVLEIGRAIVAEYPSSPYAGFAALAMAKSAVEQGDLDGAAAQLRWAMDNGQPAEVQLLARVRLARVLLSQGQSEQALGVLDGAQPGALRPLFDEARGDILVAGSDMAGARVAYSNALAGYEIPAKREVVEMKLNDLAAAEDAQ